MKNTRNIPSGTQARLRLLATTDLHMHLMSYDYYADRVDNTVGLVRTAGLIQTARDEAAQSGALTLLFDNGDSLQGTPMGDPSLQDSDRLHPLMLALDHLRYDAIGLGNHDFNFGLDPLLSVLQTAPCPVVCSNLYTPGGQALPGIAPCAVLDRQIQTGGGTQTIRIGILSVLPPQTMQWDAHLLRGNVEVGDMIVAARLWAAHLRQVGCDVVVALAHSGLDDRPETQGMENAVLPLAALDGIDAVIAGHTHLHLPGQAHSGLTHVHASTGQVHGKPVVMAGSAGSHLGVIDLKLEANAQGRWQVADTDCALRPIYVRAANGALTNASRQDQGLTDLLAPAHAATRALMHKPVGHTQRALHSYFSFIAADHAMALVAAAQAAALRALLAGTPAAGLPLLSATAPCKFGARAGPLSYTDVPAGDVLLRHAADLHLFPNELRAVIVTGTQILDWLEQSSALFHQITPANQETPLIDPSVPGHDFDVLHGLTWEIDLAIAPRCQTGNRVADLETRRINDVRLSSGAPVLPDQRFVVALNSYRAGGGGGFVAVKEAESLPISPLSIRDIICDYLSGALASDPLATSLPAWRFKPMPGTSVTVQTGPGASAHLDELANRNVTVNGPGADGFLRLTLPL